MAQQAARRGRKRKFKVGDRVKGKVEAPASFRTRVGTVSNIGPGVSEYAVTFDDSGQPEYLEASWLEHLRETAQAKP